MGSGTHLLSHAVSSIVSSAVQGLTFVFGMGTGVSPVRIGTRNLHYPVLCVLLQHTLPSITKQYNQLPYFALLSLPSLHVFLNSSLERR